MLVTHVARDEEGLVDAGVDAGGRLARVGRDRGGRGGVARGAFLGRVRAMSGQRGATQPAKEGGSKHSRARGCQKRCISGISHTRRPIAAQSQDSHVDVALVALARDEVLPRLVALGDDLGGVLLVLGLARERKGVLRLAVRDLVDCRGWCESGDKFTVGEKGCYAPRSHSLVARMRPGMWRSTSSMSLSLGARGSLTSTTMTFQSVSPSSRRAMTPRTLTCLTWPV